MNNYYTLLDCEDLEECVLDLPLVLRQVIVDFIPDENMFLNEKEVDIHCVLNVDNTVAVWHWHNGWYFQDVYDYDDSIELMFDTGLSYDDVYYTAMDTYALGVVAPYVTLCGIYIWNFHQFDGGIPTYVCHSGKCPKKNKVKKPKPWKKGRFNHYSAELTSRYNIELRDHCAERTLDQALQSVEMLMPVAVEEGMSRKDVKRDISEYYVHHAGCESTDYEFVLDALRSSFNDHSYLVGMIESIVSTLIVLERCTTIESQVAAVMLFLKSILPMEEKSLLVTCIDILRSLIVPDIGPDCLDKNDLVEQGGLYEWAHGLKSHLTHPAVKHAGVVMSLLVTVGLVAPDCFTLEGFRAYNVEFQKLDFAHGIVDTVDNVLLSVTFFLETGYKCFQQWSFKPLTEARDLRSKFSIDASYLESHIQDVINGNYEIYLKLPDTHFGSLLMDTIVLGGSLVRGSIDKYDKVILSRQMNKLYEIDQRYQAFVRSAGLRIAPFCVKIYGPSSVGKTTLNQLTMKALLTYNGYDATDESIVNIQPNDKFMPNMKSSATGIILDDMCNAPPNRTETNPAQLLIMLVGNVFVYAPMAEVEKKGRISLEPKLVGITTNKENLDAYVYSNEPFSILRRCHIHVAVKMRPEFQTDDKLDSAKVAAAYPEAKDVLQDIWLIDVKTVKSKKSSVEGTPDGVEFLYVTYKGKMLKECSIFEYLDYAYYVSEKYFAEQRDMVKRNTKLEDNMQLCKECKRIAPVCSCMQHQAGLVEDYFTTCVYNSAAACVAATTCKIGKDLLDYAYSTIMPSYYETQVLKGMIKMRGLTTYLGITQPLIKWYDVVGHLFPAFQQSEYYAKLALWMERKRLYKRAMFYSILGLWIVCVFSALFLRSFPLWIATSLICILFIVFGLYVQTISVIQINDLNAQIGYRQTFEDMKQHQAAVSNKALSKLTKMGLSAAALLAAVEALKFARRMYVQHVLSQQTVHGNLDPDNEDEVLQRDKQLNIWATVNMPKSKCTGYSPDHLAKLVESNMMSIKVKETSLFCSAVMIRSNIMLMPYHMWFEKNSFEGKELPSITLEIMRANSANTGSVRTTVIPRAKMYRIDNYDAVLVYDAGGGVFRDLTQHFVVSQDHVGGSYIGIRRNRKGIIESVFGEVYPQTQMIYNPTNDLALEIQYPSTKTYNNVKWRPGDCMTTLVLNRQDPKIAGFHLLGFQPNKNHDERYGCSIIITRPVIECALVHMSNISLPPVHSATEIDTVVCGKDIGYSITIDPKSPVLWLENMNMTILGSCSGGARYVTDIRSSILVPELEKHFGPQRWAGPNFAPGGRKWQPWYDTLVHLSIPRESLDFASLERCMQEYTIPLIEKSKLPHIAKYVRPLDMTEMLSGIDGVRFIDAMNLNTAMGFPLGGSKRGRIRVLPPTDTHARPIEWLDPMFYDQLECMEKKYLRGEMCHPIFKACLKDEPTPIGKDKVRVFEAAPVVFQMAIRKYFLPLARVISVFPLLSECAVGINCFSTEWQQLHEHVTCFGDDRILAGDYSKWDLRLPAHLMMCAFEVFIMIAQSSDKYTDDDITIMRGIASDVSYATVAYNGTLIRCHGSNPSGQNLTAYINSICNSLLLRLACVNLTGRLDFRTVCKAITYGDDLQVGVSSEVSGFNHVTFASYLKENCEMVLTMPDKVSDPVPFLNVNQVDFLKRKSTFINELDQHVGALCLESIYKSMYCVKGSKYEEANILTGVITGALHELFFHGREIYDRHRNILAEIASKYRLHVRAIGLSFDDRVMLWRHHYLGEPLLPNLDDQIAEFRLLGDIIEHSGNTVSPEKLYTDDVSLCTSIIKRHNTNNNNNKVSVWGVTPQDVRVSCHAEFSTHHSGVESKEMNGTDSKVMKFALRDEAYETHIPSVRDDTFNIMSTEGSDLNDFLKRPVKIREQVWEVGVNFLDEFNPLQRFLLNQSVARRVNNYAYITGTLCVKFVVNGTNFHYGKIIASVDHWPETDVGDLSILQLSQLPHAYIEPTMGDGACIEIPLLHYWNAIRLTPFETTCMNMIMRDMNILRAIGDTTTPVSISTYAWFKDYELIMPTSIPTSLVTQAGDEYSKPVASTTATIAANMMGSMVNVPVVGRYARASELAFGALAHIFTLFGYSRPSIVASEQRMQNQPVGNLSNFNCDDSCVKLALDSKNEITVDNDVTGYSAEDQMAITNIVQHESNLRTINWTPESAARDILWRLAVSPTLSITNAEGNFAQLTPMGHLASVFKYWRGSIKFRFEVVASTFHRGKLKFTYDPLVTAMRTENETAWASNDNLNYSYIMDLAKEREYTMVVDWGSSSNYLHVALPTQFQQAAVLSTSLDIGDHQANGAIGVSVVSPLLTVTGVESPPVSINLFVSGCDNVEFAVLSSGAINNFSTVFVTQSGLEELPGGSYSVDGQGGTVTLNGTGAAKTTLEKLSAIHMGERIVSIRQLLKRYSFTEAINIPNNPGDFTTYKIRSNDFPVYAGPVSGAEHQEAGGMPVNYASMENLLTWFSPCYLMRRGSIRNKYMLVSTLPADSPEWTICEMYGQRSATSGREIIASEISQLATSAGMAYTLGVSDTNAVTMNGAVLTVPSLNPVVELECPYYNRNRWNFAQHRNMTSNFSPASYLYESSHVVGVTMRSRAGISSGVPEYAYLKRYVAAGDDFSFHYYKYAPTVYVWVPQAPAE